MFFGFFRCRTPQNNGLKPCEMGILYEMPFVVRFVRVIACLLGFGFLSSVSLAQSQISSQSSLQSPPQEAPFDPNNDPRIDKREHPNSPRIIQAPLFLDIQDENPTTAAKDDPIFLQFAAWIQKYRLASAENKPNLLNDGLTLAKMRRAALAALIKNNPKRALDWAISSENRAILPAEIVAQLETRITGCGAFAVTMTNTPRGSSLNPSNGAATNQKPGALADILTGGQIERSLTRHLVFQQKSYDAYVFGWRRSLNSKYNIPFNGITIDRAIALDINPARVLEKGELPPAGAKIGNADHKCLMCGADFHANDDKTTPLDSREDSTQNIQSAGLIAQLGNTYYFFDSREHFKQVAEKIIETELQNGPVAKPACDESLTELIEQIKQDQFFKAGKGAGNNGLPTGGF